MKTIKQWFETIKDNTVRKMLFENTPVERLKYNHCKRMSTVIDQAFSWAQTPQGYSFWQEIYWHFLEGSGRKTFNDFKHLLPKKFISRDPVNLTGLPAQPGGAVQAGETNTVKLFGTTKEFKWQIPAWIIIATRKAYGLTSGTMDDALGQKPGTWNRFEFGKRQSMADKKVIIQGMNASLMLERIQEFSTALKRDTPGLKEFRKRIKDYRKLEELKRFLKMYY